MKFIYDQLKSYVVHFEYIDNVNVCTIENVGSSVQASRKQKILESDRLLQAPVYGHVFAELGGVRGWCWWDVNKKGKTWTNIGF